MISEVLPEPAAIPVAAPQVEQAPEVQEETHEYNPQENNNNQWNGHVTEATTHEMHDRRSEDRPRPIGIKEDG